MGPAATGYFVLADRIRQAAQSVLAPVSNALFPRISRLVLTDPLLARSMLRRSGAAIFSISVVISVALFVAADHLVTLVGGPAFMPAGRVLGWLAMLPVVMSFSTFFGLQVLLPNQKNTVFNIILGSAGILSLMMILPLIQWKGAEGAAISLCITEIFVSAAMTAYLARSGFFRGKWRHPASAQ